MKREFLVSCIVLAACCPSAWPRSAFEGTWRPEYPQKVSAARKHDLFDLTNGMFECRSCTPTYALAADGADHAVANDPNYDTRSITVLDARTVKEVAKKGGATVFEARLIAGEDGKTLTELQTITGETAHPYVVRIHCRRIASGKPGSHAVSGEWQPVDYDLPNNDEDTTYRIKGNTLSMTDKLGRSFTAKLDGTDAAYHGSPAITSVSVRMLDSTTLEEKDKSHGKVVGIVRWKVDPDGTTIHAHFDDTHGGSQEQTGHRLK